MSDPRVTLTVDDHVAMVRLNRPGKHNGLDGAMFEELRGAADEIAADPAIRAVVLSGAGPSFCAGLDVEDAVARGVIARPGLLAPRVGAGPANHFQAAADAWRALPVPVIAAIHGTCFGGGLQIALAADLRFVAPTARLSVMEIRWGLVPDMGLTVTLPPLVRQDVARDLTYTGRVVSGTEAAELGLATWATDAPLDDAVAYARGVAAVSPDAVRFGKRLLTEAWDGDVRERLELESELQRRLIGSPNQRAAATAAAVREPGAFGPPLAAG